MSLNEYDWLRRWNERLEEQDRLKETTKPKTLIELEAELPGARAELEVRSDDSRDATKALEEAMATRDERQKAFDRDGDQDSRTALQQAMAAISANELSAERAVRLKSAAEKRVAELEADIAKHHNLQKANEKAEADRAQREAIRATIRRSVADLVEAGRLLSTDALSHLLGSLLPGVDRYTLAEQLSHAIKGV